MGAAVLGSIIALAAFVRLVGVTAIGLNSDEAVYAGQAAAIAGDAVLSPFFPIFRAHPLLVQSMLAVPFSLEVTDTAARVSAAVIGLVAIVVVYALGSRLYGRRVGLLAALFMALMPYHVVVSRQFLLDGPLTLLTTLALYCLTRFGSSGRHAWLYAAAAVLGLAILTKETAIVFIGATYAFLALAPAIEVRLRHLVVSMLVLAAVVACFPLSLALAGGGGASTAQQYFVWQLLRRPNHELTFYPLVVPPAIGLVLLALALAGLWAFRSRFDWRSRLLVAWALVPIAFFELWPTKGFQYLLPIAPVVAILAARFLLESGPRRMPDWLGRLPRSVRQPRALAIGLVVLSLALPTAAAVLNQPTAPVLAGGGGVPGGREAGQWIDTNLPAAARLMTIGPSMGNILQFYGHRPARALSVSPNPLRRNPSYEPITNADLSLRTGEIQYLVWDAYSAARTAHFSGRLLDLARRYDARLIHTESLPGGTAGAPIATPVIQIYEVLRSEAGVPGSAPPSGGSSAATTERPAARREYIYAAYALAVAIALGTILHAVVDDRRTARR
jgi:hypothetical protein